MHASSQAPLLPPGDPLFDDIPAPALVLDQLPAAVGDGTIRVRNGEATGIMVVRDRSPAAVHHVDSGGRSTGDEALDLIRGLGDATVSAARLDPEVLDLVLPFLLSGSPCYQNLRLAWTDWHQLIADLRQRPGSHLIQVSTPDGSGATVITDGRHRVSYTESLTRLGDETLLDELAHHPNGTVAVFHVSGAEAQPAVAAAPPRASTPPHREAAVRELLPSLKLVARDRLHRSSERVERLLDDAVDGHRPLDEVLADIRGLAIRGVMPATLDRVADDIRTVALGRPA